MLRRLFPILALVMVSIFCASCARHGSGLQPIARPEEGGASISVAIPGTEVGIELVWCPPGEFLMGSPDSEEGRDEDEGPQRWVRFRRGFWMGKYEVTQAQWEAVMGTSPFFFRGAGLPAENLSWDDCQEFIKKINQIVPGGGFRLPSEAEWEYACRAGTTTRFCFGDEDTELGDYAWYGPNSVYRTHPAGIKNPNAWGLYDMHGNVWEWCQDWYHNDYQGAPRDHKPRIRPAGIYRVLRGGYWLDFPWNCRSANRYRFSPNHRDNNLGFRLARSR